MNLINEDRPFTDLYDTIGTGGFPGIYFMNRPVIGGHFALLALERGKEMRRKKGLEGGQTHFQWNG
jgi:hypothetical protein